MEPLPLDWIDDLGTLKDLEYEHFENEKQELDEELRKQQIRQELLGG